jgi:phosphomannomutase
VVVGRDARTTGSLVNNIVTSTLRSLGINVTDLGLTTTPTVEVAVTGLNASGGIILTASHNPANWNALKLLNEKGEFLSGADGEEVLKIAASEDFSFAEYNETGTLVSDNSWNDKHIEKVLSLAMVNRDAISKAGFSVVVDCINSTGGIILPALLEKLGVKKITLLNGEPTGLFAHNPEPLPENLGGIASMVRKEKADVGFVVDPDVDRLAIVCEDGSMFGEEYTLVAVADRILSRKKGNTVSNMSSTRALKDITEKHGGIYFTSAVGEVNVVEEMKLRNAVIGGEGNGGVIYPELHYGRDALVGIAIFLSLLAERKMKCSELRRTYPDYFIAKKKMTLAENLDMNSVFSKVKSEFMNNRIDERDGMRIDTETGWVQVRKSNTEPIIRIYAEGNSETEAEALSERVIRIVKNL